MMLQTCSVCGKTSDEVPFGKRMNSFGVQYHWSKCKSCQSQSRRTKLLAIRKLWGPGNETKLLKKHRPPEGTPCECCGKPMTHGKKGKYAMQFDHDPITSTFRGWLCKTCNTAIGGLGDTLEGIQRASRYLIKVRYNRKPH